MATSFRVSFTQSTGWRRWREFIVAFMFILVSDLAFWPIGRWFLFTPWAASGDITLSEELYWSAGKIPDVVFMGDSRTGDGIKPLTVERVLNEQGTSITAVSIWLAGAGPAEGQQIVDNLLNEQSPKLVIFNLNENRLVVETLPTSNLKWDEKLFLRWPEYNYLQQRFDWRLRQISGTLRWGAFVKRASYNVAFSVVKVVLLRQPVSDEGLGQRHGYLPRFGRQRDASLETQRAMDELRYANYEPTEMGVAQLESFLATAKNARLRLVVVLVPMPPDLFANFPPERYATFLQQAEMVTARYGVPLCNYYQEPRMPSDGFFDNQHLNDIGAEAFSQILAREVVAPALQDWNQFECSTLTNGDY